MSTSPQQTFSTISTSPSGNGMSQSQMESSTMRTKQVTTTITRRRIITTNSGTIEVPLGGTMSHQTSVISGPDGEEKKTVIVQRRVLPSGTSTTTTFVGNPNIPSIMPSLSPDTTRPLLGKMGNQSSQIMNDRPYFQRIPTSPSSPSSLSSISTSPQADNNSMDKLEEEENFYRKALKENALSTVMQLPPLTALVQAGSTDLDFMHAPLMTTQDMSDFFSELSQSGAASYEREVTYDVEGGHCRKVISADAKVQGNAATMRMSQSESKVTTSKSGTREEVHSKHSKTCTRQTYTASNNGLLSPTSTSSVSFPTTSTLLQLSPSSAAADAPDGGFSSLRELCAHGAGSSSSSSSSSVDTSTAHSMLMVPVAQPAFVRNSLQPTDRTYSVKTPTSSSTITTTTTPLGAFNKSDSQGNTQIRGVMVKPKETPRTAVSAPQSPSKSSANESAPTPVNIPQPLPGQPRALWSTLPEVHNSGILQKLTKKQIVLKEREYEIFTTQITYTATMKVLVDHFYSEKRFKPKKNPEEAVLNVYDEMNLFSNCLMMHYTSEILLKELAQRWQKQTPMLEELCDLIKAHFESQENHYKNYIANIPTQTSTLEKLKRNQEFCKVLTALESHEVCRKLPLHSFLSAPMKRVTQLRLMLENLLKEMRIEKGFFKKEAIQHAEEAYDVVSNLLYECERSRKILDNNESKIQLSSRLAYPGDYKAVDISNQALERQDPLRLLKPNLFKPWQKNEVILILLTNTIILTKLKQDKKLRVLDHCSRSKAEVVLSKSDMNILRPATLLQQQHSPHKSPSSASRDSATSSPGNDQSRNSMMTSCDTADSLSKADGGRANSVWNMAPPDHLCSAKKFSLVMSENRTNLPRTYVFESASSEVVQIWANLFPASRTEVP